MTLTELLNPSFFLFLGILLLAISFLIFYFENKMRDQNHKINSMFSLVSSITEELNNVNMRMHYVMSGGQSIPVSDPTIHKVTVNPTKDMDKIEVSDDDDSEGEDTEGEDEEDDDEDDEDEEGEDDEDDEDDEDEEEGEGDDEKTYYQGEESSLPDLEEFDDLEEDKKVLLEESPFPSLEKEEISLSNDLKSIHISFDQPSINKVDYKKLSVNQLRALVVEKGLVSSEEVNKLKKGDLYKLLGEPKVPL
jgi:hypothetical protein